eukprot:358499-Chlamydomonas_euryale.AAC.1
MVMGSVVSCPCTTIATESPTSKMSMSASSTCQQRARSGSGWQAHFGSQGGCSGWDLVGRDGLAEDGRGSVDGVEGGSVDGVGGSVDGVDGCESRQRLTQGGVLMISTPRMFALK